MTRRSPDLPPITLLLVFAFLAILLTSAGEVRAAGEEVDTLTIKVSGDVDAALTLAGEELSLTGGCTGESPISLGFFSGYPTEESWSNVEIDTTEVVGTGQLGTFEIPDLRWDHGVVQIDVGGGATVAIPNRFSGPGLLDLKVHEAKSWENRRMAGSLSAERLKNESGQAVTFEADFDIEFSCGLEGY